MGAERVPRSANSLASNPTRRRRRRCCRRRRWGASPTGAPSTSRPVSGCASASSCWTCSRWAGRVWGWVGGWVGWWQWVGGCGCGGTWGSRGWWVPVVVGTWVRVAGVQMQACKLHAGGRGLERWSTWLGSRPLGWMGAPHWVQDPPMQLTRRPSAAPPSLPLSPTPVPPPLCAAGPQEGHPPRRSQHLWLHRQGHRPPGRAGHPAEQPQGAGAAEPGLHHRCVGDGWGWRWGWVGLGLEG